MVLRAGRFATFSTFPLWIMPRKCSMPSYVMFRFDSMVSVSFGPLMCSIFAREVVITAFAPVKDRGLQHARMLERRRGDQYNVDIRGEHLFEVRVDFGILRADLLPGHLDAVVEKIAQGGYPRARIVVDDGGVVGSPVARSDQGQRDSGIGLRPANGFRLDDRESARGRAARPHLDP